MPMPDATTEHRGDKRVTADRGRPRGSSRVRSRLNPNRRRRHPRRSADASATVVDRRGWRSWLLCWLASLASRAIELAFNTVSTDDAYVNGHVTFVAPRVGGQISRVFVDDNNRVHKGEILAQLDKEPYEVAVSQKQAEVDTAMADLQAATAAARGIEAEARSQRWALQHAIENVDNQIAVLDARVAALNKSRAALALAQAEFAPGSGADREECRQSRGLRQASGGAHRPPSADVTQTLAEIYQVRVSLGLPAHPENGAALDSVPSDLDETFSGVLQAQSDLIQSAAQLGVVHSFDQSPKEMVAQFEKLGDIDTTFARLAADAPAVKQAQGQARSGPARSRSGTAEPALLRHRRRHRRRRHPPERQSRRLRSGRPEPDGGPLAQGHLGRRQFQGNAIARPAHRHACRSVRRHVRRPPRLQGPGFRLYDGNGVDAGAAACGECNGKLCQGRPAPAGSN